jgi:hypothetical protein
MNPPLLIQDITGIYTCLSNTARIVLLFCWVKREFRLHLPQSQRSYGFVSGSVTASACGNRVSSTGSL